MQNRVKYIFLLTFFNRKIYFLHEKIYYLCGTKLVNKFESMKETAKKISDLGAMNTHKCVAHKCDTRRKVTDY